MPSIRNCPCTSLVAGPNSSVPIRRSTSAPWIERPELSRTTPTNAVGAPDTRTTPTAENVAGDPGRSEEHTSELQSQSNLVCRLLLEKKKKKKKNKKSNHQTAT